MKSNRHIRFFNSSMCSHTSKYNKMLTKKGLVFVIIISIQFFLFACSPSKGVINPSSLSKSTEQGTPKSSIIKNMDIIDETKYYKITSSEFIYYYYIYDENHIIVKSEGPLNRLPRIAMVNEHLLKFTLQTGTGIGTQWGYFYDTKMDVISRIFLSIYDQSNGMVAYGDVKKVIVRDIFDKTKYYHEFSSFREPFSDVIEPITDVEFVNDGASVNVTYLEVIEKFDLHD
jgi:hypothetical protein